MTEKYDLHCHSMASDGTLTPTELINRAKKMGITSLALTDHDTINGQQEAKNATRLHAITFIHGIEISTTWENQCIHVIGLNINPDHSELVAGIHKLQTQRSERAKKIAQKLAEHSMTTAYEAVMQIAKGGMVTRTHFADYLLSQHYVTTQQEAFNRYLGKGKPAFVDTVWADVRDAVTWIKRAGGVAVVAHPLRYKMTAKRMCRFLSFFKAVGGQGIEVVTGHSNADEIRRAAVYARQYKLVASVGSDFHTPDNKWVELGRLAPLPKNITPIWELF